MVMMIVQIKGFISHCRLSKSKRKEIEYSFTPRNRHVIEKDMGLAVI